MSATACWHCALQKLTRLYSGTSIKLASMMSDAVRRQYISAGLAAPEGERLTVIPLQGDGKVGDRVDR